MQNTPWVQDSESSFPEQCLARATTPFQSLFLGLGAFVLAQSHTQMGCIWSGFLDGNGTPRELTTPVPLNLPPTPSIPFLLSGVFRVVEISRNRRPTCLYHCSFLMWGGFAELLFWLAHLTHGFCSLVILLAWLKPFLLSASSDY